VAFTYPAMVAWDPNGKQAVKNVLFQAYATTDTGFTNPLAITDPFGAAISGNLLNSGSQGVFPQFQQAQYSTVVLSDAAHTYAWTVPSTQAGAVFAWAPNTVYTSGTSAISPNGDLIKSTVTHTSTGTYDSTKWQYSNTYSIDGGSPSDVYLTSQTLDGGTP
jgi:hypothetical protein